MTYLPMPLVLLICVMYESESDVGLYGRPVSPSVCFLDFSYQLETTELSVCLYFLI